MNTPKKQLGQHWLEDKDTLDKIVAYAEISNQDQILEIGPGLGSLTQVLLNKQARVTAIEFDNELASSLVKKLNDPDGRLTVVSQDILKFDLTTLPANYKVVANIPYYLTSNLLRLLGETNNPPILAVLLVQKEVAQRVCAKPGEMSLLSVATQMYFEVGLGQIVASNLFTPPPKVDSQILVLRRRKQPLFAGQNPDIFFRVVKAGFSERRKKLRSSLSGGLQISKQQADALLQDVPLDGDLRAQNLSIEDWLNLTKMWKKSLG